jgi:hypothetical protein
MKRLVLSLLCIGVLAGCASARCKGEMAYQQAYSLPDVQVAGLKHATPAGAMVVPPAPDSMVPYGELVRDPTTRKIRLECLDSPPTKT